MVKHTDTWAEREQKLEQERKREKEIRNEASKATITKDDNIPKWKKKEQHLVSVARGIVKLFAEQNILIDEVDEVFSFAKDLIGTIPINIALPGFERENEK